MLLFMLSELSEASGRSYIQLLLASQVKRAVEGITDTVELKWNSMSAPSFNPNSSSAQHTYTYIHACAQLLKLEEATQQNSQAFHLILGENKTLDSTGPHLITARSVAEVEIKCLSKGIFESEPTV